MKTIAMLLFATLMAAPAGSLYDFKINSLEGQSVDFSKYKGKTLLIVNTASKCGYTPQYKELQQLHEQFGSKVTILGFPANNFGAQEPGTNLEIKEFCSKNYGVSFQMFEKISVKGDDQHPLYAWLKEKTGQEPTWNFCKYLVKPDGTVKFFASKVKPTDAAITSEL
ncbi:MAG: glutathione peroxidase [Cyclobacteriaceae bacterium]|nr:glutathione peroxidase [Cyclobacteriaceae bacterium]